MIYIFKLPFPSLVPSSSSTGSLAGTLDSPLGSATQTEAKKASDTPEKIKIQCSYIPDIKPPKHSWFTIFFNKILLFIFFYMLFCETHFEIGPIFLRQFKLYMFSFTFGFMFANICFEKKPNRKIYVMCIINIT